MKQNIELFTRYVLAYCAMIALHPLRDCLKRTSPLGVIDELICLDAEYSDVSVKDVINYLNVVTEIAPDSRPWCAEIRVNAFLLAHAGIRVTVPDFGDVYFTRAELEKKDGLVRWQLVIAEDEIQNAAVDMAHGDYTYAREMILPELKSLLAA